MPNIQATEKYSGEASSFYLKAVFCIQATMIYRVKNNGMGVLILCDSSRLLKMKKKIAWAG